MAKSRVVAGSSSVQEVDRARGADKSSAKKKKSKADMHLNEHVRAVGGDESDLALLSGVRDEQLVQGSLDEDPKLQKDVSAFLQDLQSTGKPKAHKAKKLDESNDKESKKSKDKRMKDKNQKVHKSEETKEKLKAERPVSTLPAGNKNHAKLVFPPNAHWYSAAPPLAPPKSLPTPTASQVSSLTDRAASLLSTDVSTYQASAAFTGNSASDSHFLNTILSKGTLSDRLSALTLLVQASPVHNIKALETLKGMAERGRGKGGREEGLKAVRCIVDWWIGGGAPARKLRYIRDQPLMHVSMTDEHLIAWYFEDWLKKFFYSVLQILETYSLDPLPYVRTQTLGFISTLLREKPEQEQNLLRLLVNKLGDTEKSVCSRASYHLLQVLQTHPAMKSVIVREVKALIFRPAASTSASIQQAQSPPKKDLHIRFDDAHGKPEGKPKGKDKDFGKSGAMERWNSHAWYYSTVALNQIVLTANDNDRDVARILIEVYFEMFSEILGGTVGSRGADKDEVVGNDAEAEGSKKKGKARAVRGDAGFAEVEDANSRLISAVLTGVNRALPFAKMDVGAGSETFQKYINTLFLITHTSTFNISLQALVLILQISTTLSESTSSSKDAELTLARSLADRFYRTLYGSLLDSRLAASNKQAMYLNLLFKALKADNNLERVKAFVRRFIQILAVGIGGTGGVEFISGGLYLLGELFSTVLGLRSMLSVSASQKPVNEADAYDPRKRDPQYAHASTLPLYELMPLLHHYHPAISLHARQLLESKPVTATADLSLNTLAHFLDRFVYKNPKKPKPKGVSAMQPAASVVDGAGGVKLVKGEVADGAPPVNDEKWWRRKIDDVPVDQVFFHKYFTHREEKERKMKEKVRKRKVHGDESQSEVESADEEEDEEQTSDADSVMEQSDGEQDSGEEQDSDVETEIWKAMKATMPVELEDGLSDSENSDGAPSGLDDSDEDDENEDSEAEKDQEVVASSARHDEADENDDAFSLAEASDAEDLLPLDEVPGRLIDYDSADFEEADGAEEEEWTGIGSGPNVSNKRKRSVKEDGKTRRKKLRSLPTFASYEDYAKMIEDGPEDNI